MTWDGRGFLLGLLAATLLSGALRLTRLDTIPVSLYCDEAFSGYEAWCLLQTGRDSRGVTMPLFFDIFGKGWGEPLYIYLTVPAVAAFGLTPFAARFAAAAAGTLAVAATGLLARASIASRGGSPATGRRAGLAAAALMAISPWPFHLSRVAFQASLLPVTLAAGFWLASVALRGPVRPRLLAGAAAVLGLSLYTYTVARLALPLLLAGFGLIHRRRLLERPKASLAAASIVVLFALPIAGFSLTERGRQRFSDVSILSREDVRAGGPAAATAAVASNYLSYYSPGFLLTEGDPNLRHSVRGHGMLHPHDLLLLAAGILACLIAARPGGMFLLWWFVSYPIAAALTIDARHAVRAICGQPALYALAGIGLAAVWEAGAPRRPVGLLLLVLIVGAAAIPTAGYFHDYFVEYPVYSGPVWQYGLDQVYAYVESVSQGHDSIYITRNEDFPFIQFLFYRAYPPREYQARRLSGTKYLFDQEVFYKGARLPNRLHPIFVWKPYEVPSQGVEVRRRILYPDGTDAFVIAW